MATLEERKIGAVVGSAVADAAAQPIHWIYDLHRLDALLKNKEEIEFYQPSANPYYCIDVGKNTCYGDQAFVVLESLVSQKGLDTHDLKGRTYKAFGPESEYESKLVSQYTWKGELKAAFPVKNPWRHFSIKHFLKNVEEGKVDTGSDVDEQIDSVAKIAPVVALYAGQPDMLDRAEDAIRLTQNVDFTVVLGLAAARLIEQYILYGSDVDAIGNVINNLGDSKRRSPNDLDAAVAGYLRKVKTCMDQCHREVVTKVFRND